MGGLPGRAGRRPWPGCGRSAGPGRRGFLAWRVFAGERQRRPGPAQVPGQHADQHMGPDVFLQSAEDHAQVQIIGFDVPEIPLDVLEVLVGGDHAGGVQLDGGDGGAQHVEPVQGGLGIDLVLPAGPRPGWCR